MRFLLLTWVIIVFILTCTKDVYLLLEGEVEFVIAQNPHWSNLFTLYPLSDISKIEFVGHFLMFFILTGLLTFVFKRMISVVLLSFLYGAITELLQPFFSRGAEGVDLLANAVGIIALAVLHGIEKGNFRVKGEREPRLENEHTGIHL